MTSKSLRRQLAAAIAMVLVASMALGTSTFAWFVNNNKVTAQGMSVNATADSSLLIKGTDENEIFGSIGTSTIDKAEMKPATSSDGVKFAKLGDAVVVKEKGNAAATWTGEDGDLVKITDGLETYVETANYTIKSIGEAADVYVSGITLSAEDKISRSIRVAVTIGDVTRVYKAVSAASNLEGKVGDAEALELVADTAVYTAVGSTTDTWTIPAGNNTDTTGETGVVVKVWFEGQDVDCFTDNIKTTGTSVTIDFSKA